MGLLSSLVGIGETGLSQGDSAPEFSLPNQHGETVRLSDFAGKQNAVVYFYPKDDTPGCTKESCAFRDQFEDFTQAGAVVIGISSDSVGSHKKFAAKYNLPFTLLADASGSARKAFEVPASLGILPGRVTYVIDKQGIIQHAFSSQMNPVKHIEEALKILERLG